MGVHPDQMMGWQWGYCSCSASGERRDLRKELGGYNELGRGQDP